MKISKNDWGLHYNLTYVKSASKTRLDNKKRFAVHLCPDCKLVYEEKRNQYKNIMIADYYEGFPTRGLVKRVCTNCKEKE